MVMVDDVVASPGADDHRDHVPAQELRPIAIDVLAPLALLLAHLPNAHGDLGGPEFG